MLLCSFGHVASTGLLLRNGLSRRQIEQLALRDDVVKVRRGVLACRHLHGLERSAVLTRARIDCISALRERGIWAGHDSRDHLLLSPTAKRPIGNPHETVWHWRAEEQADPLRVSIVQALRQAMLCLPADDVVAALESAPHLKEITRRQFYDLIADAPRRLSSVLAEAEADPCAQSGPETHVRMRFRRAGYRVRPQVFVPGVGHVDNLIEDVVALDTDGRAYHAETFEEDRRRDLATEWMGIRSLRIPATYVFTRWDWVSETVARMVRDGLAVRDQRAPRRRNDTTRGE